MIVYSVPNSVCRKESPTLKFVITFDFTGFMKLPIFGHSFNISKKLHVFFSKSLLFMLFDPMFELYHHFLFVTHPH